MNKGIVYYTDNTCREDILRTVQVQIDRHRNGIPVVSVSLSHVSFGDVRIVMDSDRGPATMFRQILAGLEAITSDIVFFAENDVLYSESHFAFVPPDPTRVYYNLNVWQVRASDGHCVFWEAKKVSQLCAYRELLIEHYRKRVIMVEHSGFSMKTGYEPASHNRKERVDDLQSDTWWSEVANIDIRHDKNLSKSKWSPADFRDKRNCINWQESDGVPGWGKTEGRFQEFLEDVTYGIIPPRI